MNNNSESDNLATVRRSRKEIIEAETLLGKLENEGSASAEYTTYAYDVFRWLRGDSNSILGRQIEEWRARKAASGSAPQSGPRPIEVVGR